MMMKGPHKIPLTILICDDNEGDRALTQLALEDARIVNDLRFVANAEQLLDYLHQRGPYAGETGAAPRPGLILFALHPRSRKTFTRIEGDSALRGIPVVFLQSRQLGMDDRNAPGTRRRDLAYLTKPLTFSGLVDALNGLGRYWLQILELPLA